MMPMDLQDRAQYLSLALFSQKIISALMEYADENKSAKLKPFLEEALTSLRSVRPGRLPVSSQAKVAAFASYEHLRTLDEVWSTKQRDEAIRMIQAILRGTARSRKTKLVANELINLFAKLQNQALWNFEQPKPVSPKVMKRLCQMA